MNSQPTTTFNATRTGTATSGPNVKARQLVRGMDDNVSQRLVCFLLTLHKQAQLQSQLAQLSANLSDTDSLVRVTAAQAAYLRELGSWHAGMQVYCSYIPSSALFPSNSDRFMSASKVLGEDGGKDARED